MTRPVEGSGEAWGRGGETIKIYHKNHCNINKKLTANIGTLSVQELFFQLIGWLGVKLGVSPVGMVYFMG